MIRGLWALGNRLVLMAAVGIASFAAITFSVQFPAPAIVAAVAVSWRKLNRWQGSTTSYGSARIVTLGELTKRKMISVN